MFNWRTLFLCLPMQPNLCTLYHAWTSHWKYTYTYIYTCTCICIGYYVHARAVRVIQPSAWGAPSLIPTLSFSFPYPLSLLPFPLSPLSTPSQHQNKAKVAKLYYYLENLRWWVKLRCTYTMYIHLHVYLYVYIVYVCAIYVYSSCLWYFACTIQCGCI